MAPEPRSPPPPGDRTAKAGGSAFPTTQWSLVVRAVDDGVADGRGALDRLCRAYWKPLYWFARKRGASMHDAEDLTQAFFVHLLERHAMARADPARGRFRTFLLTAFQNFWNNERARAGALKRGGGVILFSTDDVRQAEAGFQNEVVTTMSPEKLYDQKWAASVLDRALGRLQREYTMLGKLAWFEALKDGLWGGRGEVSYAELSKKLESTEGAVKTGAFRLRQRFRECLRAEIADTVLEPEEIDVEMRHLLMVVGA